MTEIQSRAEVLTDEQIETICKSIVKIRPGGICMQFARAVIAADRAQRSAPAPQAAPSPAEGEAVAPLPEPVAKHDGGAFVWMADWMPTSDRAYYTAEQMHSHALKCAVVAELRGHDRASKAQPKGTVAQVPLALLQRAQQAINWHMEPNSPAEHNATMLELSAIGWPGSVAPTQAPAVEAAPVPAGWRPMFLDTMTRTKKLLDELAPGGDDAQLRAQVDVALALLGSKPPVQGSQS